MLKNCYIIDKIGEKVILDKHDIAKYKLDRHALIWLYSTNIYSEV